ncbi:MAG: hypothetical protein H7841_05875 [Magnetospirillum sp. WYHS-4]
MSLNLVHSSPPPDGGGGGGDIVARVGALEAEVKLVRGDLAGIKERLANIEGRLANLPTTFQMLTWFVGVAMGLTGLVFAIARTV